MGSQNGFEPQPNGEDKSQVAGRRAWLKQAKGSGPPFFSCSQHLEQNQNPSFRKAQQVRGQRKGPHGTNRKSTPSPTDRCFDLVALGTYWWFPESCLPTSSAGGWCMLGRVPEGSKQIRGCWDTIWACMLLFLLAGPRKYPNVRQCDLVNGNMHGKNITSQGDLQSPTAVSSRSETANVLKRQRHRP